MNRIVINADRGEHTISRHIYGHFSEHLGRCIYDGFWVGEESPIPNVRGIRSNLVEALRAIRIPNLRWPGGCYADKYHWRDGIGPREERPTSAITSRGGVIDNNHFGTHEFMDLCEQLECEPYICGNVGSGTVQEMQQWLEYLTSDGNDTMANMRRANGREIPWKIHFWGVGNENWACGGNMRPEYYADLYRQYATFLHNSAGDPLYLIACGPNAGAHPDRFDNYTWTDVLMDRVGRRSWSIAGLSLHYYAKPRRGRNPSATEFNEEGWITVLRYGLLMNELIRGHSTIMDRYDPEKKVALVVDEWGTWHHVAPGTDPSSLYQQNTLRDALVASGTLDIFNHHCDRVRGAQIAQTINVLQAMALTEGEKMLLTPTYHVFDMYKGHQDATLVPITIETESYTVGDISIPSVSASASRNSKGGLLLTMSNLDPNAAHDTRCEIRGTHLSAVTGRLLTAETMQAHNTFDSPNAVQPVEFDAARLKDDMISVELPAKSVVSLELE